MVDIAALLSIKAIAPGGEIAQQGLPEMPGIDGFEALLAAQLMPAVPTGLPPAPVPVTIEEALVPASVLPESGKLLPVGPAALPDDLPEGLPEDSAKQPELEADPAQTLFAPILPVALPMAPERQAEAAPTQPEGGFAPRQAPPQVPAATSAPAALPLMAANPVKAKPGPAPVQRVLAVADKPLPEAPPEVALARAPLAVFNAPVLVQAQVRPRAASAQSTQPAQPAQPVEAAALPTLDLLRPKAATAEPAPLLPVIAALPAQAQAGAAPPPAPLAATAIADKPLDFAALVDRLVEARDAVRPHAVEAAIAHTDFGQVSLRFNADDAGLSVTMASPDPDFARAAQAAIPAVPAAPASADAGAQNPGSAPRQDAPFGSAPNGGQQPAPQREQRAERQQPEPRLARHADTPEESDRPANPRGRGILA